MSYANGTTNYNLPLTVGTDKRDWTDTNTAFAAVDAALKGAVDGVATDAAAITDIQADLNTPTTGIKARLTAVEDDNTTQGNAISTLQETVLLQGGSITNLQTAVAGKALSSAIAEPYSAESTYAVGDVVMYQGARYVCSTAILVAEEFDATHWTAEDVESVLSELNSKLTTKTATVTTSASGFVYLTNDHSVATTAHVFGVSADGNAYLCIPYQNASHEWGVKVIDSSDLSAVNAQTFTLKWLEA